MEKGGAASFCHDGSQSAVSLFTSSSPSPQRRRHRAQRGSQQKAVILLRREAQSTYYHRWMSHTLDLPGRWEGCRGGESASFPGSQTVSVLCEQRRPSSVLAALTSQPVQAGVKLIWKSSTRGRNGETHRRRGDAECACVGGRIGPHWRYSLPLAIFQVEKSSKLFLQKLTYCCWVQKQEMTQQSEPAITSTAQHLI